MIEKNEQEDDAAGNNSRKFFASIFEYVEIFAFSVAAVLIIFSFCARLCRVDGKSMQDTLQPNEMLIISDLFYTPDNGDIVVFHEINENYLSLQKPLVKRVIATGGQTVHINFNTKDVTVTDANGNTVDYSDEFATYYNQTSTDKGDHVDWRNNLDVDALGAIYDAGTETYSIKVPEGQLFVMGDNRNFSSDSRSALVGFVDERTILGKVLIRLKPFTVYTD